MAKRNGPSNGFKVGPPQKTKKKSHFSFRSTTSRRRVLVKCVYYAEQMRLERINGTCGLLGGNGDLSGERLPFVASRRAVLLPASPVKYAASGGQPALGLCGRRRRPRPAPDRRLGRACPRGPSVARPPSPVDRCGRRGEYRANPQRGHVMSAHCLVCVCAKVRFWLFYFGVDRAAGPNIRVGRRSACT